jgi:hypothetical protein
MSNALTSAQVNDLLNAALAISHQPAAGGSKDILETVNGVLMIKLQGHNIYHAAKCGAAPSKLKVRDALTCSDASLPTCHHQSHVHCDASHRLPLLRLHITFFTGKPGHHRSPLSSH